MIKKKLTVCYLSFFGSGFAPKAPGTFGSLASIPLLWVMMLIPQKIFWVASLVVAIALTCFLTENYQQKNKLHDPQWIVIDEVLGMMVTWLFVEWTTTPGWKEYLLTFALFRFFDIVKIWPASYFDRLHHGAGTILDDIVSAIYAGLCTYGVLHFLN